MGLNGRQSDVDVFRFILAEKLGRTVAEIDEMSHAEYVGWIAFHEARNASENMREVGLGGR